MTLAIRGGDLWVTLLSLLLMIPGAVAADPLRDKRWIHGSLDCADNGDPAVEVYRHDPHSFILRQNKCDTYEAPFLYLLLGDERALLVDTGAIKPDRGRGRSLGVIVADLIGTRELLVIHSHSHRDHQRGDALFTARPNTEVVPPTGEGVTGYFRFDSWPEGEAELDLGGRRLTIIPTPGHQAQAISVYDRANGWLLTGDTLYPGTVYVQDWAQYRASIHRLASFAEAHPVNAILGAHIEMSRHDGRVYPLGATYQPEEAPLPLTRDDLTTLHVALRSNGDKREIASGRWIVRPMSGLQKTLSTLGRWLVR